MNYEDEGNGRRRQGSLGLHSSQLTDQRLNLTSYWLIITYIVNLKHASTSKNAYR
jgi:hypothetical protein